MNHPVFNKTSAQRVQGHRCCNEKSFTGCRKNKGLNWEGKDINGFKISVGPGYGIDVHLAKPYTQELDRWNIFNFILNALGRSEYANRTVYNGSCLSAD